MGDKIFWHGIHRTLLSRLSFPDSGPTYLMRFDFDSLIMNYAKFVFCGKGPKGNFGFLFFGILNLIVNIL